MTRLLHRLAIGLAALGDWALRTQLDQPLCRFANDTAGEDDNDPWPECKAAMERINQRVREGYYTRDTTDTPPF